MHKSFSVSFSHVSTFFVLPAWSISWDLHFFRLFVITVLGTVQWVIVCLRIWEAPECKTMYTYCNKTQFYIYLHVSYIQTTPQKTNKHWHTYALFTLIWLQAKTTSTDCRPKRQALCSNPMALTWHMTPLKKIQVQVIRCNMPLICRPRENYMKEVTHKDSTKDKNESKAEAWNCCRRLAALASSNKECWMEHRHKF